MVQEKVERENTLSKPVQDLSDTPKAVHSFLLDPRQQLTLEEHRQKHERVTPDWRNNNVLKSIKARSQTQSQLQTVDNQASIVPQKELQSNTSRVGTQAKDNNSYQVASIWDDAVHQAQKFLNQVEKLGEDFWETAKGGKQKLSDYGNAIGLSLQYIPQAIAQRVDGILKEALAGLAISLIAAIGVVSLTTAIGGAIGSLGGGVGAVPGAAAGLRVGIFLLDKMGLMFLWGWIASGLTKVGVALGHFLATVWDANGNSSAIDKGARQLADGMAQFIVLILEGIVAQAIAQGQSKALEMLGNSWFGKQLGPARLEQWLKQQLKARDTGGGSAGEAITPDGQRMRIHGETPQRQQPMRMQGNNANGIPGLVKAVSQQVKQIFPGIHKFLTSSRLSPDALGNFLKIANEAVTNNIAHSIAQKVMQHSDIPGLDRWLKLASRHVKDKSQLLDLQNSLDDAIRLQQAGEKGVEVEAFYSQGKKLTTPADITAAKTSNTLKNVDVVTQTMRREFKRVNSPINSRNKLLQNVKTAFQKFSEAQLARGTDGQRNIAIVDLGNNLALGGQNENWALQEITNFLYSNNAKIHRQFIDEYIIRINNTDHSIIVPPP
jgi:hypothetical protein